MKTSLHHLKLHLFYHCLLILSIKSDVNVTTDEGIIQGFSQKINNVDVYTFLGVPFAKPPVGKLRFASPQPMSPWKVPKITRSNPPACYQPTPKKDQFTRSFTRMWLPTQGISEDCLYLNIWSKYVEESQKNEPIISENKSMPVMVWIHGGGFVSGSISPEVLNGAYLAGYNNVVVVTIQYRLGLFGQFFADSSHGYQALKDQILALKWIKKNIAQFGGKKEQITLFGNDAGATSIISLIQEPEAKELFHQAIIQSPTFNLADLIPGKYITKLMRKYGCLYSSGMFNEENVECLRSISPELLAFDDWTLYKSIDRNAFHSSQTISANSPFFKFRNEVGDRIQKRFGPSRTKNMTDLHRLIIGFTQDEGSLEMYQKLPEFFKNEQGDPIWNKINLTHNNFYDLLRGFVLPQRLTDDISLQYLALDYDLIGASQQEIFTRINKIIGDIEVKCNTFRLARYAEENSFFIYSWEKASRNANIPPIFGVPRGSEIEYVFGMPFNDRFQKNFYNFTNDERLLSKKIMEFWTNFASTGNPNLYPNSISSYNDLWKSIRKSNFNNRSDFLRIKEYNSMKMDTHKQVGKCQLLHITLPELSISQKRKCGKVQNRVETRNPTKNTSSALSYCLLMVLFTLICTPHAITT